MTKFLSTTAIILCASSFACSEGNTGPIGNTSVAIAAVSATALSGTARAAVDPTPTVVVRDGAGNPLPGVRVVFYVAEGAGTVTPGVAVTDKNGVARVDQWVLGPRATERGGAAPNTLWAIEARNTTHVTFTADALPGPPLQIITTQLPGETLVSGWAVALNIRVLDASGNYIPRVPVSFAVTSGGGSPATTTATTDLVGNAPVAWVLGAPGLNEATVTVGDLPPVRVEATAMDAGSITWY
ncbi:MAG TPA: Ig-like domain-containing protein, partial [Gemmatimonadaceae bacterium]